MARAVDDTFPAMAADDRLPDARDGGGAPSSFWWGVSSSAYQTEDPALAPGDPMAFATDWDLFRRAGRLRVDKGDGTRSFSRMERDVAALRTLGVSHYRFGVEWARVEPRP